ncbi:MAG: hypothetical protein JWM19_6644, partial [Actinomycetia bacterium]|nr:hypothetical protein [Actinomycetes bacterium]
ADVNAARNIAAGHAVKARRGDRDTGPVNREPQLALPFSVVGIHGLQAGEDVKRAVTRSGG